LAQLNEKLTALFRKQTETLDLFLATHKAAELNATVLARPLGDFCQRLVKYLCDTL
jgi:hypothetical protein